MGTISLKAMSFNKWNDPCDNKVRHCSFIVKIKDLPNQSILPVEPVNTRKQDVGSKVARKIISSAKIEPSLFHLKGKGMTFYVRKFEFKKGVVSLFLSEDDGLGDGAHSFLSSLEAVKQTRGDIESCISVNVISGLDKAVQRQSSLYRNTSIANKDLTRHNYQGHFDLLKNAIENEVYSDMVSYIENDNKELNPRWLISILSLFVYNNKNLKDCLSNREKVLKEFISSQKNLKKEYYSIAGASREIFELYDFIWAQLESVHSKELDNSCSGLFKEKSGWVRPFSRKKCKFSVPDSVIFPILASFSDFVIWNGKEFAVKNKSEIKAKIVKNSGRYYRLASESFKTCNYSEYRMAASREYWKSCNLLSGLRAGASPKRD